MLVTRVTKVRVKPIAHQHDAGAVWGCGEVRKHAEEADRRFKTAHWQWLPIPVAKQSVPNALINIGTARRLFQCTGYRRSRASILTQRGSGPGDSAQIFGYKQARSRGTSAHWGSSGSWHQKETGGTGGDKHHVSPGLKKRGVRSHIKHGRSLRTLVTEEPWTRAYRKGECRGGVRCAATWIKEVRMLAREGLRLTWWAGLPECTRAGADITDGVE